MHRSARKLRLDRIQRCSDGIVHIKIFILPQSSAEYDLFLPFRKRAVLFVQPRILRIVDGIIRLVPTLPFRRIFAGDDRFGLRAEFKMLMLDDARVRYPGIGIIDNGVP